MFKNDFVVTVKGPEGHLKESGDSVMIPFNTEYSVYLKNMKPQQKAVATIKIDGNVVIEGIIVDAGKAVTVERFVEGFSMQEGPKLKFIERIKEIEDHRGIKPEDGLLTVEWQFERYEQSYVIHRSSDNVTTWPGSGGWGDGGGFFPAQYTCGTARSLDFRASDQAENVTLCSCSAQSDVGITTEGASSDQSFTYSTTKTLEAQKHTMTLKLRPLHASVTEPEQIYTRKRVKCKMCGCTSRASDNFCSKCGTAVRR